VFKVFILIVISIVILNAFVVDTKMRAKAS